MAQLEGIHGDELADEILLHVAPHPFDDGDHGDEEHHTDAHAQEREDALQLLGADGAQRQTNGIKKRHGASRKAVTPCRTARARGGFSARRS
jgi:hypothetical protein